jgi:hypothetical protein
MPVEVPPQSGAAARRLTGRSAGPAGRDRRLSRRRDDQRGCGANGRVQGIVQHPPSGPALPGKGASRLYESASREGPRTRLS